MCNRLGDCDWDYSRFGFYFAVGFLLGKMKLKFMKRAQQIGFGFGFGFPPKMSWLWTEQDGLADRWIDGPGLWKHLSLRLSCPCSPSCIIYGISLLIWTFICRLCSALYYEYDTIGRQTGFRCSPSSVQFSSRLGSV